MANVRQMDELEIPQMPKLRTNIAEYDNPLNFNFG